MSSPGVDRELDTVMRDWAQHSISVVDTSHLDLDLARTDLDTARVAAPTKRLPRWVPVAAAGAVTMLVIAVGLLVRHDAEQPSPPAAASYRCPARPPVPPSEPSPTNDKPMFGRRIDTMIVCSYTNQINGRHTNMMIKSVRLSHTFAVALAGRLNRAPTTVNDNFLCLFQPGFSALIARDATGHSLPMITVRPGCSYLAFLTQTSTRYLLAGDPAVQEIRAAIAHTPPPLDRPTSTGRCGAWSAIDGPQALAVRIQHGTIDSCQRVGMTWFVTTISASRPGQVGYLVCTATNTTCLDGSSPHALTSFRWVSAPATAGPGLKLYSTPTPNEWIFSTRAHGMVRFNVASKTFSTCPSGVCH